MPGIDDFKTSFEKKLEEKRAHHAAQSAQELAALQAAMQNPVGPSPIPEHPAKAPLPSRPAQAPLPTATNGLVELSGSDELQELDAILFKQFNLNAYYPFDRLNYRTIYCETLEEFYSAQVETMDYSVQVRQEVLKQLVAQTENQLRNGGGYVAGYNQPGKGAYINGYGIAYHAQVSPKAALKHPQLFKRIKSTTIHEKHGHGLLLVYSAMGQVKLKLGLGLIDLANQFELPGPDDPTSRVRILQHNMFHDASQYLEEGWATWVQSYLGKALGLVDHHPCYQLDRYKKAVEALPDDQPGRTEVCTALDLLFENSRITMGDISKAILILQNFSDFALPGFQPLPYVVGELLFSRAEINLGALCVPLAALIAANVTFDPASMGLADLQYSLNTDTRFNLNMRLAALTCLNLKQKNNVQELIQKAMSELSFSIPAELKPV